MLNKPEIRYEQYKYLVSKNFNENLELGMELDGAAGKTLYELEPMMMDDFSYIILSVELCYLFAVNDISEQFFDVYNSLFKKYKKHSLIEIFRTLKITSVKICSEFDYKSKRISNYSEQFYDDSDVG